MLLHEIDNICSKAGEHLSSVIKMLWDGVGFPRDSERSYHVFSHEGDELGILSNADVNFAIHFMKRQGYPVGKLASLKPNQLPGFLRFEIAFTFAWQGFHPFSIPEFAYRNYKDNRVEAQNEAQAES